MRIIGLDIGGANIKASDGEQRSVTRSFPLWKHPDRLAGELRSLLDEFARPVHLAVTMTGELADCFATKAEGVGQIIAAVTEAADRPVHLWQTSGEFVDPEDAVAFPMLTAAANWHALATWAGRMTPQGSALLLDMGSTTTDVIPMCEGLPQPAGTTDVTRLQTGELVYTGARRTPVCAVARSVDVPADRSSGGSTSQQDGSVPLAAEFFATMHDVALILGDAAEEQANCDTADGRPATRPQALARLARMLCCDRSEIDVPLLERIARQIREQQQNLLQGSVSRVLGRLAGTPAALLLSGEGENVLRSVIDAMPRLADCDRVSLRESLGPRHSTAACAFALARLGRERIR